MGRMTASQFALTPAQQQRTLASALTSLGGTLLAAGAPRVGRPGPGIGPGLLAFQDALERGRQRGIGEQLQASQFQAQQLQMQQMQTQAEEQKRRLAARQRAQSILATGQTPENIAAVTGQAPLTGDPIQPQGVPQDERALAALTALDPGLAAQQSLAGARQRQQQQFTAGQAKQKQQFTAGQNALNRRLKAQLSLLGVSQKQSTALLRNLAAAGIDPNSPQGRQLIIDSISKPATNISVNTFQKERDKTRAKRIGAVEAGASTGQKRLSQVQTLRQALDTMEQQGATPGIITSATLPIAQVMTQFGLDPAAVGLTPSSAVPAAEFFQGLGAQSIIGQIGGEDGFPRQNFSNRDLQVVERTVPMLANTPQAIRAKLLAEEAVAKRVVETSEFFNKRVAFHEGRGEATDKAEIKADRETRKQFAGKDILTAEQRQQINRALKKQKKSPEPRKNLRNVPPSEMSNEELEREIRRLTR